MKIQRRTAIKALSALALSPACNGEDPLSRGRQTISLWYSYGGKNREVLLGLIQRYHQEQDRYFIRATYQGDYFEALAKLRTALAAGKAPALSHIIGEILPYMAEAGVLKQIDPFVPREQLELIPALAQDGSYFGGNAKPLYALPFNRSTPIVYYNKSIFTKLNLMPPRTWDELREVAKAATVRSKETTECWGFECPVDWWFWAALVGQAGGQIIENDGTPSLGGEAGIQALQLWQTMVYEDHSMKPPAGRDYNAWQVTNTDFLAGRAAMIWTSTSFLRYLEETAKFPVGAAPLPKNIRHSVPLGGTLFVMPKGAPEREHEGAVAFLKWMMEARQANEFALKTGYIPVSQAGLRQLESDGYYQQHPNDRVAIDQLLTCASPWPWAPLLFRVQREAVQPRLEQAVTERKDARLLLAEARRAALET